MAVRAWHALRVSGIHAEDDAARRRIPAGKGHVQSGAGASCRLQTDAAGYRQKTHATDPGVVNAMNEKNPLNRQWFYRGFHKHLKERIGPEKAALIWSEAGSEYARILSEQPDLKARKGAMVLPAVALYRALSAAGVNAEPLLNAYGDRMGKRFAGIVHGLTRLPGISRLIWKHIDGIMNKMSGESLGYKRRIVSNPPEMYGALQIKVQHHYSEQILMVLHQEMFWRKLYFMEYLKLLNVMHGAYLSLSTKTKDKSIMTVLKMRL